MTNRGTLVTMTLIALLLIPAVVLSASPKDEDDYYAYLPLIRMAGQPANTWAMAYGYDASIRHSAEAVVESGMGGFVYGGTRDDTVVIAERDILITKTSPSGEILWQKRFDGVYDDLFADMDRAADGKLIIAGGAIGKTTESRDAWLAKLDDDGSINWQKLLSAGSTIMRVHDIQPTADGGFVAVGNADSGDDGLWIVKMNGDGNLQWQTQYAEIYASSSAIVEDGQGGYFVGGTWDWDFSGLDIHLQHLDSDGKIIWQKAFGESPDDDWFMALESAPDSGFFVAGLNIGESWSDLHFWLMKVKGDGSVQWHKELIGEWDMINVIRATPDGGCLVSGNTADGDMWLLKMNANGTAGWQRFYRGSEWDEPRDLLLVSSGGYMLAGRTSSYGSGDINAWLLRTDEAGYINDCSIDEAGSPVLVDYSLPVKTPTIMATAPNMTLSAGDLVASDDETTRTVVCEATAIGTYEPVQACQ